MLPNYWVVARRFIIKNKIYSSINVLGLAIGIASTMVLLVYVSNELSFDKFHVHEKSIYRLLVTTVESEGESTTSTITAAVAPTLKDELPEVIDFTRFSSPTNGFFTHNDKEINTSKILYADSSLFGVFTFELLKGDKSSALASPYSILLTPRVSKALFADKNPIGQTVLLNGEQPLLVTGVIDDAPPNSQIQYSVLISFSTLEKDGHYLDWNGGWNYFSYVKLASLTNIDLLKNKFPDLMYIHINKMLEQFQIKLILDIQPLREVHLGPAIAGDWDNKGNIQYIYIFGTIAILILLMASINFINLTASQAVTRIKEIGVRKAIGANKKMLVYQFLFESFIFTLIAFGLALLLLALVYTTINDFLGFRLEDIYLNNLSLVLFISLTILIVSIGSGAYPAFYLSSISSINSLKSNFINGTMKRRARVNGLVVFQFLISIILIAGTWFINNQLKYIQAKGLGYDKENVLVLSINSKEASNKIDNLKVQLLQLPEVANCGASTALPGDGLTSNGYIPEGRELPIMLHVLDIDESYLPTMGLKIVSGRNFSKKFTTDKSAFLVNETLVKEMGWDNPIGKIINRNGDHEVIGVVKDFNYASLHEKIEPLLFTIAPWRDQYSFLSVRINSTDISNTIDKVENAWMDVNENEPFEFNFLDQEFESVYFKEQQQAKLLFAFSILAILIGGMGLFGVVSFSLKQKTKEIGLRKVLGATPTNLLTEISMKYILSIIIASTIAIPIVYVFIKSWLDDFYYRVELNPIVFVLSVLIALAIALVTINMQTLSAVNRNPTESLKYE
jgi:putative ABC transport system permease protein